MFLEQIVTNINNAIEAKLKSASVNISLHGISIQAKREDEQFPVYFDNSGEGTFNAIDDRFALCIYHKCNSLDFETTEILDFGDGEAFQTNTANMSVFIYGDRKKLKMIQETVILIVASALPATMPQSFTLNFNGLSSANISTVSSPNNSQDAWRQEFQNIEYTLAPEKFFVQLNYTIETIIQKSCIEVCAEC